MAMALHVGVFKMDATAAATSLTDYSSEVTKCTLNSDKNIGQHHTIGSFWAKATEGGGKWSIDLEGEVNAAAASLHGVLRAAMVTGGSFTVELYAPSALPTSVKYTGEVKIGALTPALPIEGGSGEVKKFTARLTGDGVLTDSVVT